MPCTFHDMSRRIRPHLPGATFHLTTRVQNREALFTPELRSRIVEILCEQITYSDVELFAYVIMPNHLHLVIRQGNEPLARFMQPLLRRAALLVQRSHRREGHIFERRFRDRPCTDADYIRNSIVYTHLNPVRAGMTGTAGGYPWSSHGIWASGDPNAHSSSHPISLARAAQLFASDLAQTPAELSRNYLAFLAWRQACDRAQEEGGQPAGPVATPPRPVVGCGDESWVVQLTPRGDPVSDPPAPTKTLPPRPDLRAIAIAAQKTIAAGLDPEIVRSRWGGATYVRARHEIILRAAAVGYRGVEIAAFLRITPSAVYDVISAARRRRYTLRRATHPPDNGAGQ